MIHGSGPTSLERKWYDTIRQDVHRNCPDVRITEIGILVFSIRSDTGFTGVCRDSSRYRIVAPALLRTRAVDSKNC